MKKVVEHSQSVYDTVIQHYGNLDSLFEFIALNNLSVTDDLKYGSEIEIGDPVSNQVIETFIEKKITPATDFDSEKELLPEGIGYWTIGTDFVVS